MQSIVLFSYRRQSYLRAVRGVGVLHNTKFPAPIAAIENIEQVTFKMQYWRHFCCLWWFCGQSTEPFFSTGARNRWTCPSWLKVFVCRGCRCGHGSAHLQGEVLNVPFNLLWWRGRSTEQVRGPGGRTSPTSKAYRGIREEGPCVNLTLLQEKFFVCVLV